MRGEYFLYKHYTHEGRLFYIGIGKKCKGNTHYQIYKRAYDVCGRNFLWKRMYKKYGREVVISADYLNEEDCKKLEIELIAYYGKIIDHSGILCNLSNGGEGRFGDSSNSKKVYCYSLEGEFIREFISAKKAAEFYSLPAQNISKVIKGYRKSCGGLQFRRYKMPFISSIKGDYDHTPKEITLRRGEEILHFSSLYSASKILHLSRRHLYECRQGKRKTVNGWEVISCTI